MNAYKQTFTLFLCLLLTACGTSPAFKLLPSQYSAEAIEGRVVDTATGEPVEDAIVIAVWELEVAYGSHGSRIAGHLHVDEVLTDAEGEYVIPGWGPKDRPGRAYLGRDDPVMVVFKDGYDFRLLKNRHGRGWENWDRREEEVHNSSWDGKTVELERFEGDLEAYYARLRRLDGALTSILDRVMGADNCDWKKIPHMMLAFDKNYQKMSEAGLRPFLIPSISKLLKRGECGTKEEFLKETKK